MRAFDTCRTAITYLVFNIAYWQVTGIATYTVLDWSNATAAGQIAGIVVFAVVPLFWVVCFFLYLWRRSCTVMSESGDTRPKGLALRKKPADKKKEPTIELLTSQAV